MEFAIQELDQIIVCWVSPGKLPVVVVINCLTNDMTRFGLTAMLFWSFLLSFHQLTVQRARKTSQVYSTTYGEVQPVSQLVKQVAGVMQEYTQRGGVRPFGISLLVGGVDGDGTPRLYQVDPSGTYIAWKATAIGKNYVNAKNFLEKRFTEDMELEDAIHTALLTLREGFEGEMNCDNIEVGVVRNGKFTVLTPEQIQDYLDEAN